jgi:aspartate aminotransferase
VVSAGAVAATKAIEKVAEFADRFFDVPPDAADFTFGNPHERPLTGLVNAIRAAAVPKAVDWFSYKTSVSSATETIAASLSTELSAPFAPEDITMTQGAFTAIALAFSLLLDAGDEVLIPKPGWFAYAPVLAARGFVAVEAPLDETTFDLDLDAIQSRITPRTRIVIVNSPHNPTGRVYTRERLTELAALLEAASGRIGHRIFILSDEPYRRIRFDGIGFTSPAEVYPWTLIDYSYGKILLSPGQRIGYLALGPYMPAKDKAQLQKAVFGVQASLGWGYPDATMQYAVPDLEKLSIDIAALKSKRDRMVGALRQWGYDVTEPQGTFYVWGKAPGGDALKFCDQLSRHQVYVMPGTLFDCPADFRICLTATSEMIERALPAFDDLRPR